MAEKDCVRCGARLQDEESCPVCGGIIFDPL